MHKAILYTTCNTHDPAIEQACRDQLDRARGDIPVVCVSREPTDYGNEQFTVAGPRGPHTLLRQIMCGLFYMSGWNPEWVFIAENDVLYPPDHFQFGPRHGWIYYYNANVWKVRYSDGHSVWTDDLQQLSGLCACWDELYEFYQKRDTFVKRHGWDRHFEPGPKVGPYVTENWQSDVPLIDIRHDRNYTRSKWSPDEFRNKRYARGWKETDDVLPGWGMTGKQMMDRIRDGTS